MLTDRVAEITQHLLRFSPDALIVVDEQGVIQFANDTVQELFGYLPAELLGLPMETLVPERQRRVHIGHVAGYMSAPHGREMGAHIPNLSARRADGSEFPAGIRLAPFRIEGQMFVAAAIRDTTEHRRINEALVAAREEADRANRAKSRFLATASHDLRQPLQAIRLLNAAMQKTVTEPQLREMLDKQGQSIDGTTRMLNALLDISRLESGAFVPQLTEVRLGELLSELCAEFEPVANARGLDLRLNAMDAVLLTDRVLFRQLLENLLGNAVKYTDHGQVEVGCTLTGDALLLWISDTGIGIPEDKVGRIFDEYYQVDASGQRRTGVGLGLAIVREATRLLGYSIKVSSTVGRGTRVELRVPGQCMVEETKKTAPPAAEMVQARQGGKSRLVLVEDDDDVRAAMQLFLDLEGYETVAAGSVAAVHALFDTLRPTDILIVDYHLDGGNTGLELIDTVRRQLGRELPVIVLSGDLPSVQRMIKTPLPNSRLLSKPVDVPALIQAIEELSRS